MQAHNTATDQFALAALTKHTPIERLLFDQAGFADLLGAGKRASTLRSRVRAAPKYLGASHTLRNVLTRPSRAERLHSVGVEGEWPWLACCVFWCSRRCGGDQAKTKTHKHCIHIYICVGGWEENASTTGKSCSCPCRACRVCEGVRVKGPASLAVGTALRGSGHAENA